MYIWRLKKSIVILLLTSVLLQSMHSVLSAVQHFVQYELRFDHHQNIVHIQIPVADFENGKVNMLEKDEWKWNDNMYDVIATKTIHQTVYVDAYQDSKDEAIHLQEKKQHNKKQTQQQQATVLFCADLPVLKLSSPIHSSSPNYNLYTDKIFSEYFSKASPPPNYC
ncbi:MAG: hypothetical protein RLZZ118_23 [Bacteroidota bacterium]